MVTVAARGFDWLTSCPDAAVLLACMRVTMTSGHFHDDQSAAPHGSVQSHLCTTACQLGKVYRATPACLQSTGTGKDMHGFVHGNDSVTAR